MVDGAAGVAASGSVASARWPIMSRCTAPRCGRVT
jgi:hypothetical protein